jgi:hypothetical protein
MSLRERLGFGRHEQPVQETKLDEIVRLELAHQAIFAEILELRDVCKFLLNGRKNHIIIVDDKPVFNITCLDGSTTKIKYSSGTTIDDYSVNNTKLSRNTITHSGDTSRATLHTFDITSSYRNGFSEVEMTEQLKALYDLQEAMLIADGYILPVESEVDEEHYAA